MTLGEKLDAVDRRPSGFGHLRLALCLSVFAWHTVITTNGFTAQIGYLGNPYFYSMLVWVLPAFFSLSGFLVGASLARCRTLAGFLYLRAIRIFPALGLVTVLWAFVFGPLLGSLPHAAYFRAPEVQRYLLNCVGVVHFRLPGLFAQNAFPSIVNLQLWTIPYELKCYGVAAALALTGLIRNRWLMLVAVLVLFARYGIYRLGHHDVTHWVDSGPELVLAFLSGMLFHAFRDLIPYSRLLCAIAALAGACLFLLPNCRAFAGLPVAYVVAYIGLTNLRTPRIVAVALNYSYGIYLYGFPIQQAVAMLGLDDGLVNLGLSFPPTLLLAACSWHFWERRWLAAKGFRPRIDDWFTVTRPGALLRQLLRDVRNPGL